MQIPIKQLRRVVSKAQSVVSLESPIRYSGFKSDQINRQTIGDVIASDALSPEEDVHRQYLKNDIRAVINKELAEREREVLIARFGLDSGEPLSASHTAQHLGVTVDQVRLIEAKALNKLRSPQRNHRLKDYINLNGVEHCKEESSYHHLRDLYNSNPALANTSGNAPAAGSTDTQELSETQFDKLWFF
jgi:RNA polymerase primary sigma factor